MNECGSGTRADDSVQGVWVMDGRGGEHGFECRTSSKLSIAEQIFVAKTISELLSTGCGRC